MACAIQALAEPLDDVPEHPYCAERSARGKEWESPPAAGEVGDIPPGVSSETAWIALSRGFDDLETYFKPSLRNSMPDPFILKGMEEATARFCAAVRNSETIAILGDYDVDGATSTAILMRWLRSVGHEQAMFYIPDRMKEGYGPNANAVEQLASEGATLLMVVDSGTTAFEPLDRARDLGLDVIIIDHHEPGQDDPYGILVNPKRKDEDRTYEYLCTAGLAFLLLVATNRKLRAEGFFDSRGEPDLRDFLGIVALGTVCDMVPLVGLNRAYVTVGLPLMGVVPGLMALCDANGESAFTARSCGFVHGPCINAAGRIDDTRLGTILLTTDDPEEARELARKLVKINEERRDMQKAMVEAALERGREEGMEPHPVIVMHDESWHPGVVGLVASKVMDAFDRPAVIIGEKGKSSCRSVPGFDIGNAVIRAREAGLLVAGGGHAMAAGLTVETDHIDERIDALRSFLAHEARDFSHPPLKVDLAVACGGLGLKEVYDLSALGPFDRYANPEPRIAVVGGYARRVFVMKGKHVKVLLQGEQGQTTIILFNGIGTKLGDALACCEGKRVDVLGKARIDTWNGVERVQVIPEDAMIEEVPE